MTLLDRARTITARQFKALNTKGINFGGREAVKMQVYARSAAGSNPMKTSTAFAASGDPINLIPIDLEIGQVRDFKDGVLQVVGDARVEIAREDAAGNLLTMDRLLGKDLALEANKQLRYLIGNQAYTLADSRVKDLDGVTWQLTLQKVPG